MNAAADSLQNSAEHEDHPRAATLPGTLTIISGTQQGASSLLEPSAALTLGSSLENDIVLRDPTVERQHMMVTLDADVIQLQCLGGTILVDGLPVLAGDSAVASASALVQLGNVALSINCSGFDPDLAESGDVSALSDEGSDGTDPLNTEQSFFMPHSDDLPALQDSSEQVKPASGEASSGGKAGFLTLAALSLGAIVVWQSGLFSKNTAAPASLSSLLAMSPFSSLIVEQQGSTATVSGYVDTFKESLELGQWLDQSGLLVVNEVMVGEALGEQVADVFRVNGVMADVEVIEGGEVYAITQEADTTLLDTIQERVMTDVPLVASLLIDNTPPPVVQPPETARVTDPGKRVALVVSDKPSYIVTEDQSRYFIGSVLPTGHRIADIKDGKVSLEKQGVTTTLEF